MIEKKNVCTFALALIFCLDDTDIEHSFLIQAEIKRNKN